MSREPPGGTGISPTDATPEATRAVLDYEIPGLADAIRRSGLPKVPTLHPVRACVRGGRSHAGGQPARIPPAGSGHGLAGARRGTGTTRGTSWPVEITREKARRAAVTDELISLTEHEALRRFLGGGSVSFAGVGRNHGGAGRCSAWSTPRTRQRRRRSSRRLLKSPGSATGPAGAGGQPSGQMLEFGHAALVVAVAADHYTFETCARLVDTIKAPHPGVEAPVLRRRVGELRLVKTGA